MNKIITAIRSKFLYKYSLVNALIMVLFTTAQWWIGWLVFGDELASAPELSTDMLGLALGHPSSASFGWCCSTLWANDSSHRSTQSSRA